MDSSQKSVKEAKLRKWKKKFYQHIKIKINEKKKQLVKETNKIMRSSYYTKYEWPTFPH